MATRVAAAIALAALIGGSIFFVKISSNTGADDAVAAGEHETGKAAGEKPKPAFDLKEIDKKAEEAVPKFDFDAIPEVIAEIDGKPIKKDEYVKELKNFQEMVRKSGQPIGQDYLQEIKDQILAKVVDTNMLMMQAAKEGITVDPAEVTKSLDRMKASIGDEAKYKQFMASRGFTEDTVKEEIAKGMRIRALFDKVVAAKVQVAEKEAREFYDKNPDKFTAQERVRAAHILIMSNTKGDEADNKAKAKAQAILDKLKKGEDFAATAKAESEDKGSGANGGDLGWFTKEEMVPEFAAAAFSLQPGKLSELVRSQFGYHIIKTFEKKPAGKSPFEEVKESLLRNMKMGKSNQAAMEYIDKLHKDLKVKSLGADGKLAPPKPRPSVAPSNPHGGK